LGVRICLHPEPAVEMHRYAMLTGRGQHCHHERARRICPVVSPGENLLSALPLPREVGAIPCGDEGEGSIGAHLRTAPGCGYGCEPANGVQACKYSAIAWMQ
jgi:hypothetical protein